MNKLEKLLYEADPSANAANKEALRSKFLSVPKTRRNWARPDLAAACICLLVVGAVSTGAAQAAVTYVKEIFFTKEVVEPKDVIGQVMFSKPDDFEEPDVRDNNTNYSVVRKKRNIKEISIEEATSVYMNQQNITFNPFMLPETLPRDLSFTKAEVEYYSPPVKGRIAGVKIIGDNFNLTVYNGYTTTMTNYTETEIYEYTIGDIKVYSFSGMESHNGKIVQNYYFIQDGYIYWFRFHLDSPLTDDELVEMIESMK